MCASRADDRGVAIAEPTSCSTHWIWSHQSHRSP